LDSISKYIDSGHKDRKKKLKCPEIGKCLKLIILGIQKDLPMRKNLFLLLVLFLSLISCNDGIELDVISLNIRYDNPSDGENIWQKRKDIVVDFLEGERADIFGLQEALINQYTYIDSLLVDYKSVAAGRDDGKTSGEMSPVFYKSKRFEALDSDTFWLSETPGTPGSKGWGAVLPRIVTWVKLYDKRSKEEFYFFNTHFSHMSDSARTMSAKVLSSKVLEIAGDHFFVISGDFNMMPGSDAYAEICAEQEDRIAIRDTYTLSSDPLGPLFTFNRFAPDLSVIRIDYVFARDGLSVYKYETHEILRDGVYISDHWPVEVSLAWSNRID
jgi:endonuclease/exonuclease/phosphatase family metal-dependent hydrolase